MYKTRYFNTISYNKELRSLCKESVNVEKIKSEYQYYYALPENLQRFFVQPYGYEEVSGVGRYYMEKFFMEDAAKQMVSGEMTRSSYDNLFDRLSLFLAECPERVVDKTTGENIAKLLVMEKTRNRLTTLDSDIRWIKSPLSHLLIEKGITKEYLISKLDKAYKKASSDRSSYKIKLSHGDLCFSNILWSNDTDTLKLIDPKGIESLYLDIYYDVTKLGHSVVGRYDDIVYGNYEIDYNHLSLKITRDYDPYYEKIFYKTICNLGLDYDIQKIYQASIFLSMTPNHLDDDNRVLAFILNANQILDNVLS